MLNDIRVVVEVSMFGYACGVYKKALGALHNLWSL